MALGVSNLDLTGEIEISLLQSCQTPPRCLTTAFKHEQDLLAIILLIAETNLPAIIFKGEDAASSAARFRAAALIPPTRQHKFGKIRDGRGIPINRPTERQGIARGAAIDILSICGKRACQGRSILSKRDDNRCAPHGTFGKNTLIIRHDRPGKFI